MDLLTVVVVLKPSTTFNLSYEEVLMDGGLMVVLYETIVRVLYL